MCQLINRSRDLGYHACRWTADALKRPFYSTDLSTCNGMISKIAHAILMGLGLALSIIPRKLANWLNPHDYCYTKGNAEAIDIDGEISVLTFNILGFPAIVAADENQDFWLDRFDEICKAIEDSDADVVCLQEVHCGSWLENKLIERFEKRYSGFYGDIAPKAIGFGSGLFIMHRMKDATLKVDRLKNRIKGDRFVNKAAATLIAKHLTITNTHMQSGSARENKEFRKTRCKQTKQIIEWTKQFKKQVNIICGDTNEDRTDEDSYKTSLLNPENRCVIDGFKTHEDRMAFTQADLKEDRTIKSYEAVDNVVAVCKDGDAHCKLSTKQVSSFITGKPSDHAAMRCDVTITSTAA